MPLYLPYASRPCVLYACTYLHGYSYGRRTGRQNSSGRKKAEEDGCESGRPLEFPRRVSRIATSRESGCTRIECVPSALSRRRLMGGKTEKNVRGYRKKSGCSGGCAHPRGGKCAVSPSKAAQPRCKEFEKLPRDCLRVLWRSEKLICRRARKIRARWEKISRIARERKRLVTRLCASYRVCARTCTHTGKGDVCTCMCKKQFLRGA